MKTYHEFRKEYDAQHPAFIPKLIKAVSPYPRELRIGVFAMFIAAALLSGVHTIPTIYGTIPSGGIISETLRQIAAYGSIVVIELALFVSVYVANNSEKKLVAGVIQVAAFTGAVAANIHSVFNEMSADGASGIVGVIIGILPPLVALLSGEAFIRMTGTDRNLAAQAERAYRNEMREYDGMVLAAFESYRKEEEKRERRGGTKALPDPAMNRSLPSGEHSLSFAAGSMNGSMNGSVNERANAANGTNGSGYSKNMNARQVVEQYLRAHADEPGLLDMKTDDLKVRIDAETGVTVGRTTVHNVRSELRAAMQANGNGGTAHADS